MDMKKFYMTYKIKAWVLCLLTVGMFTACENEPDGDDLYTATGKTINDYIVEDADLTSFEYILQRIGRVQAGGSAVNDESQLRARGLLRKADRQLCGNDRHQHQHSQKQSSQFFHR